MPAKLIDLSGQRFGKLIVIRRAEDYYAPCGHKSTQWLCACNCGQTVIVRKTHLIDGNTTSCGCEARIKTSQRSMKNIKNQRFGMLIAIERIPFTANNGRKSSRWKCICDCGNTTYARTSDLLSGQTKSCGCLRRTSVSRAQLEDLSGQEFGWLTVLRRDKDYVTRGGFAYTQWLCKCRCGNYKIAVASRLKNGFVRSCGCLAMSTGEQAIDEYLYERHIDNIYSYAFPDLIGPGGGLLIFDFAILDKHKLIALIEYQGAQHYLDIDFGRQQREITDPMKKKYCKSHNIPLFEIKYDQDVKQEIDKILNMTIYADTVPSSESSEKV